MSALDQYSEVLRYFSPALRALISITREGVVLTRRIEDYDWKIAARKKEHLSYEEWIAIKRQKFAKLPAWAKDAQDLPSIDEIETWFTDGVCPTPTGDDVEPDGHGPDGAPSWLLALGLN